MLASFLTTVFFAVTAPIARRAALLAGPEAANFWRLFVGALVLGGWALCFGHGLGAAGGWFLVSGVAGFGLGGFLMFQALPRAGSNLANFVVQFGSAVTALLLEWVWMGNQLQLFEFGCVAIILAGLVLGMAPSSFPQLGPGLVRRGALFAVLSALGQGLGAVLSRRAFAEARAANASIDPGTATFERVLGGLAIAGLAWLVLRCVRTRNGATSHDAARAWPWVVVNALTGPVLGVTCMQLALSTTPAGIVQPIVAAAPLLTAPCAFSLGESLPRRRYFFGALIAVGGTITLWQLR